MEPQESPKLEHRMHIACRTQLLPPLTNAKFKQTDSAFVMLLSTSRDSEFGLSVFQTKICGYGKHKHIVWPTGIYNWPLEAWRPAGDKQVTPSLILQNGQTQPKSRLKI